MKFSLRVPNAVKVAVVEGKKRNWTYLDKTEDNLFEKTIKLPSNKFGVFI